MQSAVKTTCFLLIYSYLRKVKKRERVVYLCAMVLVFLGSCKFHKHPLPPPLPKSEGTPIDMDPPILSKPAVAQTPQSTAVVNYEPFKTDLMKLIQDLGSEKLEYKSLLQSGSDSIKLSFPGFIGLKSTFATVIVDKPLYGLVFYKGSTTSIANSYFKQLHELIGLSLATPTIENTDLAKAVWRHTGANSKTIEITLIKNATLFNSSSSEMVYISLAVVE